MSLALAGRRVVVTRPAHQSRELIAALEALGAEVLALPLLTIVPVVDDPAVEAAVRNIAGYDLVIVTSANGAACLVETFGRLGTAGAADLPSVVAVGAATAAALRGGGVRVDLVARFASADGILATLAGRDLTSVRILLPRARLGRPVLPTELRRRGAVVDDVAFYDTVSTPVESADVEAAVLADALIVTSPSGVEAWVAAAGGGATRPALITIGPTTSGAARDHGLEIAAEASTQDAEGLVAAVQLATALRLGIGRSSDPETA